MCDSFCVALIPAYEPDNLLLDLLCDLRTAGVKQQLWMTAAARLMLRFFVRRRSSPLFLGYANNQGKGHALKYGFNYINEHIHGRYVVVTMDADGQHRVVDAEKVVIQQSNMPEHWFQAAVNKAKVRLCVAVLVILLLAKYTV